MNEDEWMNVFHSFMQPFNHSKLFRSVPIAIGTDYELGVSI